MTGVEERGRVDKRAAILLAALDLFSRYGYRRTSIDDVARAAGIAKGSVYLHFEGKRELFRAGCEWILGEVLGNVEAAQRKPGTTTERVLAVIEAKFTHLFQLIGASPHAKEILDTTDGIAGDIVERTDKRFLDVLADVLADADTSGELDLESVELTPAQAAALIFRAAEGTSKDASISVKTYRKRLQQLVEVLVRGMRR